ncbi:cobyrinate a,c-diamide synthase [Alicyclobacillus fastidiosus]|uniref:Cobyrinate a,c-diamide synthase n=1 Tax=Alicyclobacillus fastidiosus TaxID=392011 RepID=A0ABY6ZHY4_9BACL|nr:cobyrinate a,c-diamide synthase [Alicyclobacillus fastidiosus]WAH41741.1 cobyrinate a,c-diamide synthase [Alicyclobacillus fastidiosus]GMA63430.1 cobyrinate a,c-diamide synthase [Alicyclobacillus fastidiosus]
MRPRIVIAGASSGTGKTTVTLGIMAALRRRELRVQGFKVGPDYIDPSYHTALTGRPSRNLDTWMMAKDIVREVFDRGSRDADISVIEGVMGLYDGKDPLSNAGSTAEVSTLLNAPVILVVNVSSMARSAAAVVLGFQRLDPGVNLAGIIVNRVGSKGHYEMVKAAIEQECNVPVVGYLLRQDAIDIPARHLGLVPAIERGEMAPLFDALATTAEQSIDIDRILQLAEAHAQWNPPQPSLFVGQPRTPCAKLAVARDSAFNFYYPENLELIEWYGGRIVYFRPLDGEPVPDDADGLYVGGGFPEEFAGRLSEHGEVLASVLRAVSAGMPVFAECGGFMFLTSALADRAGTQHRMVGAIPATVQMQTKRVALGYREVTAIEDNLLLCKGETARGHEFHYSTTAFAAKDWPFAYVTKGLRGVKEEGYAMGNVLAGYTHLHFASNPKMVERLLQACCRYRERREELVAPDGTGEIG